MPIHLGDITFGLGPDVTRLRQAIGDIQKFGTAVERAAASSAKGAKQTESALRRQEKAAVDALLKVQKFQDQLARAGSGTGFQRSTKAVNDFTKAVTRGEMSALEFQRAQEKLTVTLSNQQRSLQAFTHAQRQKQKAEADAVRQAAAYEAATLRQERALSQAREAVENLKSSMKRSRAETRGFAADAVAGLAHLEAAFKRGALSAREYQAAVQGFNAALGRSRRALGEWVSKVRQIDGSKLADTLDRLANVSILLAGPLSGITARLTVLSTVANRVSINMAAMVGGVSAAIFAFYKLGQSAISTARGLEGLESALTATTGSEVLARTEMNYLMKVADRAGVEFQGLAKEFVKLQAASIGTNLEGQRTRDIFEAVTFAASKLGSETHTTNLALLAIGQIMSKGKVSSEELRRQLGEHLPGAMQIMANALGIGTDKLDEMLRKGELTADTLVPFAEELKKRLGIDVTQAIEKVTASENRLWNAVTRMNEGFDNAIGFSTAYKNALESAVQVIDWMTGQANNLASAVGAVAGAMLVMAGTPILRGIAFLTGAIYGLTLRVLTLNAAMLANPAVAFGKAMLRLGGIIVGGLAGWQIMDKAIQGSADSMLSSLPSVDAYIAAQKNMQSSITSTTEAYIDQVAVQAKVVKAQKEAVQAQIASQERALAIQKDRLGALGGIFDPLTSYIITRMEGDLEALNAEVVVLDKSGEKLAGTMNELFGILNRQRAEGDKPLNFFGGDEDGADKVDRVAMAMKNATDTIKELRQEAEILTMAPMAADWARVQLEVNKAVENFHDGLVRAKVPAEDVVKLTEEYSQALRSLKEGELILQQHPSAWKAIADILTDGVEKAIGTFVDKITEGQVALSDFRDLARTVLNDIAKTMLIMGALNPFKNWLLGTNAPVLNFGSTAGIGGALGSLFGSTGSSSASPPPSAAASGGSGGFMSMFTDLFKGIGPGGDPTLTSPSVESAAGMATSAASASTVVQPFVSGGGLMPGAVEISELTRPIGKMVDRISGTMGQSFEDLALVVNNGAEQTTTAFKGLSTFTTQMGVPPGAGLTTTTKEITDRIGDGISSKEITDRILPQAQDFDYQQLQNEVTRGIKLSPTGKFIDSFPPLDPKTMEPLQQSIDWSHPSVAHFEPINKMQPQGFDQAIANAAPSQNVIDMRNATGWDELVHSFKTFGNRVSSGANQAMLEVRDLFGVEGSHVADWAKPFNSGGSLIKDPLMGGMGSNFLGSAGMGFQSPGIGMDAQTTMAMGLTDPFMGMRMGGMLPQSGLIGMGLTDPIGGMGMGSGGMPIMQSLDDLSSKLTDSVIPSFDNLGTAIQPGIDGLGNLSGSLTGLSEIATSTTGSITKLGTDAVQAASQQMTSAAVNTQVMGTQAMTAGTSLTTLSTSAQMASTSLSSGIGGGGGGGIMSFFSNLAGAGGVAAKGMSVTPGGFRKATGDIFGSPTLFPTNMGPVLGGEAGPEALLPLERNSQGELAVHAEGISGGSEFYFDMGDTHITIQGDPSDAMITKLRRELAEYDKKRQKDLERNFAELQSKHIRRHGL